MKGEPKRTSASMCQVAGEPRVEEGVVGGLLLSNCTKYTEPSLPASGSLPQDTQLGDRVSSSTRSPGAGHSLGHVSGGPGVRQVRMS